MSSLLITFYCLFSSLMFAIPRLAILCGLIIFPNGPLNVDRDSADFPELFRPFKNLLTKIRDLLRTLSRAEFLVLEKLLSQLEEPNDLDKKLQVCAGSIYRYLYIIVVSKIVQHTHQNHIILITR